MRSIGDYVSSFWILVISTGELFILKLMMALFINTYLKYFNSRVKSPSELIEDEQLNQAIADEAMKEKKSHSHDELPPSIVHVRLRRFCLKIEHSEKFENFIMCVIVVNTIVMALTSPLTPEDDAVLKAVHKLELLFTAIYGVEILIKTIACGLFCEGGYFRDPKNLIDFFLFGLNIFSIFVTASLGILNALRAFHILILSKHFDSLKIILVSLYKSLPYILRLSFFALCFMLVFGKG